MAERREGVEQTRNFLRIPPTGIHLVPAQIAYVTYKKLLIYLYSHNGAHIRPLEAVSKCDVVACFFFCCYKLLVSMVNFIFVI